MAYFVTRRNLLLGASAIPGALIAARWEVARAEAAPSVAPLPLAVHLLAPDVSSKTFVEEQIAEANLVFTAPGISFVEARARASLTGASVEIETRADRDALVRWFVPGFANVFVARSLRDVDTPTLENGEPHLRKGVTWRCLKDLGKKYLIVAAYSPPRVLAHELGHFLGCGHSTVKNNLMSYEHEEGKPAFLDAAQIATVRRTARALFADGTLASRPRLRPERESGMDGGPPRP